MFLLKKIVNFALIIADRFIPDVPSKNPQTAMFADVETRLKETLEIDMREQRKKGITRDRNFKRLLDVAARATRFLAVSDPYYELWLGYLFKRMAIEYENGFRDYEPWILKMAGDTEVEGHELLGTLKFRVRMWDLKIMGGLRLIDENLEGWTLE
tara:strand:+ start:2310 stop:2774 length:465 start_codon:yes stop_codon:yes gene_type:complete